MSGYVNGRRRLPSGKYQIRVKSKGKIHVESFETAQYADDAIAWLRACNVAARLGMPDPPKPETPLTLAEAFKLHVARMKREKRQPKSIAQVEYVADMWSRALGPAQPAALTYQDFETLIGWAQLNTNSTRGRAIQLAVSLAKTVVGERGIPVPQKTPKVTRLKRRQKTVPAPISLKFLAELEPGSVESTFAETIFRTARRETEVRRLRLQDVDLKHRILVFQQLKGNEPGEDPHPIGPTLAKMLKAYLATLPPDLPPDAPLFAVESDRDGKRGRWPLTEWSLSKRIEPAARRAGVGKRIRTLGWLRNQAATDARRAGESLDDVSKYLGHADVATTGRHYVEDERWEARKRLARAMDSRVPVPGHGRPGGPSRKPAEPITRRQPRRRARRITRR